MKCKKVHRFTAYRLEYLPLFAIVMASFISLTAGDIQSGSNSKPIINWNAIADKSSRALIRNYWNSQKSYFNTNNQGDTLFQYWPQAHALDVLVNAYLRTNDSRYARYIRKWYYGVKDQNGHTFIGMYYDDMEWNALAMFRAYQATGNPKFMKAVNEVWTNIKTGWTNVGGGGIMWSKKTPGSKNACSNGPASILASLLYQRTHNVKDLKWAEKIYKWEKHTLVNPVNGAVWDHIAVSDTSKTKTVYKKWKFTYNQGTFIGAGVELYRITGNPKYLKDAVKTANYTLKALTNTRDHLLKDEGSGDGGLFKGIFVQYLTKLILLPDLPSRLRTRYIIFIRHNAKTLWIKGTNKKYILFGTFWGQKPGDKVNLTTDLSGTILLQEAALLHDKDLIPN